MITLHCQTCRRSTRFPRASFPDVPLDIVRIEYQECNLCGDIDETPAHYLDADGREHRLPRGA